MSRNLKQASPREGRWAAGKAEEREKQYTVILKRMRAVSLGCAVMNLDREIAAANDLLNRGPNCLFQTGRMTTNFPVSRR